MKELLFSDLVMMIYTFDERRHEMRAERWQEE